MPPRRSRRPGREILETRRVPALAFPTAAADVGGLTAAPLLGTVPAVPARVVGDVNGDGLLDQADLAAFARAFRSVAGNRRYNPAADLDGSGTVSLQDGKALLARIPPLVPDGPLSLFVTIDARQRVPHPADHNSGPITRRKVVTVIGRTTPGSLVFVDSVSNLFKFDAGVLVADSRGRFKQRLRLFVDASTPRAQQINQPLTNHAYLAIDPFGHQKRFVMPILRLEG